MPMLAVALVTAAKTWPQPRCLSTDEGKGKYGISTYSGILFRLQEDEILTFTGKWMKLEIIMLNKISQTWLARQRGHMCAFPQCPQLWMTVNSQNKAVLVSVVCPNSWLA